MNQQAIHSIGISNFRSFDGEGVILDGLGKINVLIGKNNCGKSNVLRFLRRLTRLDDHRPSHPRQMFDPADRFAGIPDAPLIRLDWKVSEMFASNRTALEAM